ncbi:hypothetical protein D3C73_1102770 [compost metagenome]
MNQVDQPTRNPRLEHQLEQTRRRQRRGDRRLEHHGVARSQGGRDLVRHHVQRRVERADAPDHPPRRAQGIGHAPRLTGRALDRHDLAGQAPTLLGRHTERLGGAGDFIV